jgi:hypothetical protein
MRWTHTAIVLIALTVVSACARPSELDKMAPGTPVTIAMRDGSAVTGRLVEVKADAVLIAPDAGGDWKSLPRAQVLRIEARPASVGGPAPGGPVDRGQPAPPPAEPVTREMVIPAGTVLRARLETGLASNASRVEEAVHATLTAPIVVDGVEVAPAGSALGGVVTEAKPSGKVKGRAVLAFRFTTLAPPDRPPYRIRTGVFAQMARSTVKKDALKIGAPAAGGAIIGGLLGGKQGAAIGGAIGGGAGTAVVLSTAGEEVRLAPGTHLSVRLLEALPVRVPADRR